jgi:hypothetical protein
MRDGVGCPDIDETMAAGFEADGSRGSALLLEHLADRPPARRRLAQRIGEELARFLVFALAGDHGTRRRRPAWRRGSSSP